MKPIISKWKHCRILFLILCMSILCSLFVQPLTAEASWIPREETGIYDDGLSSIWDVEPGEAEGDADGVARSSGIEKVGQFIEDVVTVFVITIGDFLYSLVESLVGVSFDKLIFGRLVQDPPLFTFDLGEGNMWGNIAAEMYFWLRLVAILFCLTIFFARIGVAAWRKATIARVSLGNAILGLFVSVSLLIMMPYLLDVVLFLRDCLLNIIGKSAAAGIMGTDKVMSIVLVFKNGAYGNIMTSLLYVAAVVLLIWFAFSYIGVALAMTVDFILFPFVVVKMHSDRKLLGTWLNDMLSCILVPVVDAILILLPAYVGVYADNLGFSDGEGAVSIMQLLICMSIIPARNAMRRVLGLNTNYLEHSVGASMMTAAFAARGAKRFLDNQQALKKNAMADQARAEMERDLAQLDDEEAGGLTAQQQRALLNGEKPMVSAESLQKGQTVTSGEGEYSQDSYNDGSPLGKEQTYGSGIMANEESLLDQMKDVEPDPDMKSAEELQKEADQIRQLDHDLDAQERKQAQLQENRQEIEADANLSDEEKAKKLQAIESEEAAVGRSIANLRQERAKMRSVDERLEDAKERKAELESRYQDVQNNAFLSDEEKATRGQVIDAQIQQADQEISRLNLEKAELQKARLKEEPEVLRRQYSDLQDSNTKLMAEHEALVKQQKSLRSEQGKYEVGSADYERVGAKLDDVSRDLVANERSLGSNHAEMNEIQRALLHQENGLRDRQAYNLHERVAAQNAYDVAAANLSEKKVLLEDSSLSSGRRDRLTQEIEACQVEMKTQQDRLASIGLEDQRIAQKLHEISPDINQYSMEDLKKEKQEQQVRRASLNKELALENEKLVSGGNVDTQSVKRRIAKIQTEIADSSLRCARIDQAISTLMPMAAHSGKSGTAISDEYDKKRKAIMERYATVENFERPEFQDLSHEKKAQFYAERALQANTQRKASMVFATGGAAAGAMMGTWFGAAGVFTGGTLGGYAGSAVADRVAYRKNERRLEADGLKPTDYKDIPLDIHISSDVRDNSISGQRETVKHVYANLVRSLEDTRIQNAYRDELIDQNIAIPIRNRTMKENRITPANYQANVQMLRESMIPELERKIRNAEMRIIEQHAGEEYANLSETVKQDMINRAENHAKNIAKSLASVYVPDNWPSDYNDK